ncbi:MAG: hypothetical protein QOK16_130 [Solirubrobacteraceae bacterium]|nr:hypothetical protein [Solirubrobacteraceae bacterium]MEA2183948.1 hypothetical protein [Solirubrobacteraceae bacterium]MEA2185119.1 hypothetical protein [Solirubrobacteraceae bacterium]
MSDEPAGVFDQDRHEPEVLDALPVLVDEPRVLERRRVPGALAPATVQTVAVVGVSVVAGAAAATLVRRRRLRRLDRRRRHVLAPVLASRSFLVDVHVLGERK